jgi:hypothetical protein
MASSTGAHDMKTVIAHRFASVSSSLEPTVRQKLRRAVPEFQSRTRGARHAEFESQQALALAKSLFPAASAADWHSMAFYLVATSGMAEAKAAGPRQGLDSMSEMGEMESLRLQMAMDRMSKMMSTLSNLLKKASETSTAITQNLK